MPISPGSLIAVATASHLAGRGIRTLTQAIAEPFSLAKFGSASASSLSTTPASASTSINTKSESKAGDSVEGKLQSLFDQIRRTLAGKGFSSQQPFELSVKEGEAPTVTSEDLELSNAIEQWFEQNPEAKLELQKIVGQLSQNQSGPFAQPVASLRDQRRSELAILSTPQETRWQWRAT